MDRFPGLKGDAGDLALSSNGKKLITVGHRDGVVRVWDFESGKQERSFRTVPNAEKHYFYQVSEAVISADGRTIAVAYYPHENSFIDEQGRRIDRLGMPRPRPTRLWDVATGKEKYQPKSASGAMAFSPDGRFFVTSSGVVLQTDTGDRVAALPNDPSIKALAFSHDSRFLATAVSPDVIQVWEAATWTKRNEFKGHNRLTTLAFTSRGRLLSGSGDTTVLAWDLQSNHPGRSN